MMVSHVCAVVITVHLDHVHHAIHESYKHSYCARQTAGYFTVGSPFRRGGARSLNDFTTLRERAEVLIASMLRRSDL
jgi:hypothetical protein